MPSCTVQILEFGWHRGGHGALLPNGSPQLNLRVRGMEIIPGGGSGMGMLTGDGVEVYGMEEVPGDGMDSAGMQVVMLQTPGCHPLLSPIPSTLRPPMLDPKDPGGTLGAADPAEQPSHPPTLHPAPQRCLLQTPTSCT